MIFVALSTTWWFVRIKPALSTIKPVPRFRTLSLRSGASGPPKKLKKSNGSNSRGFRLRLFGLFGLFGVLGLLGLLGLLLRSPRRTVVFSGAASVLMLTTAGATFAAI